MIHVRTFGNEEMNMLFFVLLACEDVKPMDSANEEPIDIVDTAIEEEETPFEPAIFTMFASFGIEGGSIRSFYVDGTEISPNIQLFFLNQDQSQSCTIYAMWDSGSVVLEDWNFEDGTDADNPVQIMQKGFHLPDISSVQVTTSDGCADWDESLYGSLFEKVDHAWGVGFGGPLRADVEAAVQDSTDDSIVSLYENNYVIGGSWSSNLWEPAMWASHMFTVSPHDNWTLSIDDNGNPTEYLTRSEVENGEDGSIYILKPVFLWDYNSFF